MKNSPYWKQRFEQLEAVSNKDAIETFNVVQEQYIAAEKEIERQISTWYQRFAKNNQITMAEARKWLTSKELNEFKWDVKEFIKYGEQNALNPQWMKELENASARFHISRLEALRIETQQTVEKLFGGQTDEIDKLLKKNYLQNYYHTVYEIQKGVNIGWDIAAIDDRVVERLISKPWATDAKNFSDRIWSNKTSLINEVQTQLTRTFMLGKSPDDAIKAIAAKMKTSQGQAGRLVMTESAYFSSQSQKDAFNALDVERYEIVATLDSRTSAICQDLDGHVFEMKDFEPGVTAPPFHPWCRTTTVPYFDDNFTERAARGADGKTYYVDSKLNYKDWKKTFAEGGDKSGLKPVDKRSIIKKEAYVPAKTITEAQEYSKAKYGIDADYSKYNLDVANAINAELYKFNDVFGDVTALKGIGTFPKGYSTRWAGAYVPSQQSLWLRNVSPKNALEKLKSVAEGQFQMGFWSTGEAMHTIRHELGHALARSAIQRNVQGTMFDEVTALKDAIQAEVFKAKGGTAMYPQYLSKYAFTNTAEFIAESVAEYFSESPRETSTKVVEIMIKHLKGGS